MSILIRGMEMPYGCANCPFCSEPKFNGYGRSEYICNVPVDDVNGRETTDNVLAMYDGAGESFPEFCPLSKAPDSRWIPIKIRPMDDEEWEYYSEIFGHQLSNDEAVIYDSCLPDDGQSVLVSYEWGGVGVEHFCNDEDGCYFEEIGDMDGIVAWMPLPEPYKAEEAGE